jgi:uncharacterized membrane protein
MPIFCILFGAMSLAAIPGTVFWPYFAGIVILVAGIFANGKEVLRAHGTEKIVALGPIFFAIPMAVFASQHFTEAAGVATIVPRWLPWHLFWTYFIGTAIIAASLGMVTKIQGRLAAILLSVLLIVFVVLLHIPRIVAHPKDVFAWATACRDLAFSGGALAYVCAYAGAFAGAFGGTEAEKIGSAGTNILGSIARVFISVSTIFFGAVHFIHPEFLPAVDFDRSVPAWIPAHVFWSYVAGAVFLIAGASLLVNRKTRFAATWLGIMALVLILFVYLPILVSSPLDIANGLNYLVSVLAFSGAALLLARAMPRDGRI